MTHNLEDTTSLLARTPKVLNALLRDQPEIWTKRNEGGNAWTPVDVVGHLIHGERTDWIPRTRFILEHGPARTFEPFDMQGHLREIEGKSLPQLLDEFAQVRSESLSALRAMKLGPSDLARQGRHPTLGEVTLSELLASWPAHDLTHLHQLSRILAHQYREAVGPWSQYMGVLQCAGHGSR
jgi:DinB superfamily